MIIIPLDLPRGKMNFATKTPLSSAMKSLSSASTDLLLSPTDHLELEQHVNDKNEYDILSPSQKTFVFGVNLPNVLPMTLVIILHYADLTVNRCKLISIYLCYYDVTMTGLICFCAECSQFRTTSIWVALYLNNE